MNHLTFEQLSDLAESRDLRVESVEGRHIAECSACRETLRKVRELLAAARTLPRDIAPPAEVWTALRSRVGRTARRRTGSFWRAGWIAAAAAIVLFVGTAVILPRNAGKAKASKLARQTPVGGLASPVVLSNVDRTYSATLSELREALDTQRSTLAPTTVRIVERSLATIDTAIAEARGALASDPANQALVDILSAHYERKVELLQRATELSSSS